MLQTILLIGLIALVVVSISGSKRKRELTDIQTKLAEAEYEQKRKPAVQNLSSHERYDALGKIKELLDQGVLTPEEFEKEKSTILSNAITTAQSIARGHIGTNADPVSNLSEDKIIRELEKMGYMARKKGRDKWRIVEPLGGIATCKSLEEFQDYARGVLSRVS